MEEPLKDLGNTHLSNVSIKDLSIKDLRNATGLSQTQFANAYHIPVGNIRNWEQGARKPPSYIIYLLFRCIQMDIKNNAFKNISSKETKTSN